MATCLFPGKLKNGYLIKSPPLDGAAKRFKAWKRRWFVLYLSDGKLYLQYYENEEKYHTTGPKKTLLLEDCKELDYDLYHTQYSHVFSIVFPERTFYFSANSHYEMSDWVDKIRTTLDMKKSGRTIKMNNPDAAPRFGQTHDEMIKKVSNSLGRYDQISVTPPLPPKQHMNNYSPLPMLTPPVHLRGIHGLKDNTRSQTIPANNHTSFDLSASLPPRLISQHHQELPPLPPPRLSVDMAPPPRLSVDMALPPRLSVDMAPPLPPHNLHNHNGVAIRKSLSSGDGFTTTDPLEPRPGVPPRKFSESEIHSDTSLQQEFRRPVPLPRKNKPNSP